MKNSAAPVFPAILTSLILLSSCAVSSLPSASGAPGVGNVTSSESGPTAPTVKSVRGAEVDASVYASLEGTWKADVQTADFANSDCTNSKGSITFHYQSTISKDTADATILLLDMHTVSTDVQFVQFASLKAPMRSARSRPTKYSPAFSSPPTIQRRYRSNTPCR